MKKLTKLATQIAGELQAAKEQSVAHHDTKLAGRLSGLAMIEAALAVRKDSPKWLRAHIGEVAGWLAADLACATIFDKRDSQFYHHRALTLAHYLHRLTKEGKA